MTRLTSYWPNQNEVTRCIKREAETVSEAVLLAVHQPMPLTVRNAGSQNESDAGERDFVESFLTKDLPEGILLQPVTGASGAGKSHLIRWLAAQLERDPRAKRMVVVRIPKTVSLRTVVELILEPLANDPRFEQARADLHKAVDEVTPETASIRLAGGLEIALRALAAGLRTQILSDPNAPNLSELRARLDHAQRLPNYFNDPVLEEHFKSRVLARIVSGSVGGETGAIIEPTTRQFDADDLRPPKGADLGKSAQSVRTYYTTILNVRDGAGFKAAADILNDVLDSAIGEVFRLGQALGGMTLQELILRIRDLLFEDGRELVLLIEDFAALSGIQEVLLSVCIQEAVRDGKQIRAPMRTAIAITDGYLKGHDTILTRSKRVWKVKTTLSSEEDVFQCTTALISAYLNAARWGGDELERRFYRSAPADDLTGWIVPYNDDGLSDKESSVLNAFGYGTRNVPLFPYNEAAIRSLARRHLSEGGELMFKPRAIINFILRDVLVRKDLYERGVFPPENFEGAAPTADVAAWLNRGASPDVRGRLASLVVHWGGNPDDAGSLAQLPEPLFTAFNLPTPQKLGFSPTSSLGHQPITTPEPKNTPAVSSQPQPTPVEPRTAREDPEVARWRALLEEWVKGQRLPQNEARELRTAIRDLLTKTPNWNAMRLARSVAPQPFISIPNAAGEGAQERYRLAIADDYSDPDGRLRKSLMAIARHIINDNTWDYAGGDEDSALVSTFIDGLAEHYTADVEAQAMHEISGLVEQLVIQGRVLGIPIREGSRPDKLAQVALAMPSDTFSFQLAPNSPEERWQQLQREAYTHRPSLQVLLLARLGCFQGTGNTPYAIDTVRLTKALKNAETKLPRECDRGELGSHLSNLKEVRLRVRVQPVAQNLIAFASETIAMLGSAFNKEDYLREARALVASVGPTVWPPSADRSALAAAVEDFRNTKLQETLQKISRIPAQGLDSAPVKELVSVVSQIDFSTIARTREFLVRMNEFINAVEQEVAVLERTAGDADPAVQSAAIDQAFATISANLSALAQPMEVDA